MELPPPLSARNKKSFAYITVKDRLPSIVTRIVDFLARNRGNYAKEYGDEAENECKSCIAAMDKLRYEIGRDKPILLLTDNHTDDVHLWNECLQKELDRGKPLELKSSKHLQHIDPFIEMKQYNFILSSKAIDVILAQLNTD
ncbi:unnamed protein product, partial [Rotaria socialis]